MTVRYTLGTANLGLAYGTAIRRALPDAAHVETMLCHARSKGFSALDAARAYGESEARIGAHLKSAKGFSADQVGTKIAPLSELTPDSPPELGRELAVRSLTESQAALGLRQLERVLIHRASHLQDAEGAVWRYLLEMRAEGQIRKIGVSVQNWDEFLRVISRPDVDVIQLPCNILDWRFDTPEVPELVAARSTPVVIDVRSVHLQGLLPAGDVHLFPTLSVPYDARAIAGWLHSAAAKYAGGRLDELCQRYMASLGWVSALVMGADTPEQIDRISDIATLGPFPPEVVSEIRAERPRAPRELLNPALWQ